MTDLDVDRALRTLWMLMLLRGTLAVVFGLYALFSPASALLALVAVFGVYAIVDGVVAVVLGVRHRRAGHWGWQVTQGLVSLVAGVAVLLWPGPTALAFVVVVAVWSVVLGILGIVEAFAARRQGDPWGLPLAGGVAAALFGVVLLVSPGAGALVLLWIIGLATLVLGVVFVAWALRLRGAARREVDRAA